MSCGVAGDRRPVGGAGPHLGDDAGVVGRQRARLGDLGDAVVGAEHVQHVDEVARVVAGVLGAEQRLRDRTGRVGVVADVGQGRRGGELRRQPVADLVADAVEDDARVVAIALQRVGQVGLARVVERRAAEVGRLLVSRPRVEELVHHHEAHAVAQVVELGRVGVVRGADGVDADDLQLRQPPLQRAHRQRGAEAADLVVHAHAFELRAGAVDAEAGVGVEHDRPDAERHDVVVDGRGADAHAGGQRIHAGRGRAPQLRVRDGNVDGEVRPTRRRRRSARRT